MKKYEKKSFLTSVFLFFIPLAIFASIVLYMYHQDKIKDIQQNILYQMRDYTFDFKNDKFILDVVEFDNKKELFKLYRCKEGFCSYFKAANSGLYLLKVIFPQEKYEKIYEEFIIKIFKFSIIVMFILLILSFGFAFYSLRPMREALYLLENFLKDIIHDLNTPSTSILLNSKLLRKRGDFEEIERIELSAKTISSLYKNLEFISQKGIEKNENISIEEVINSKIEVLQKLYPTIVFKKDIEDFYVKTNENAFERILDNLLTNACKYNKKNGIVHIYASNNKIIIKDTGIGIKNVGKVFDRYYKETDRGLGIGLSIVKKLCDALDIKISIKSKIEEGTSVELVL
ncbi:HAMP domain-containing sensor histidine kinase [Halarcobacter sp.]|uniref:sensor histidine kinase n=1 Tax=Halarcobacter sp. TaxID=2321133 RepID=UPI0029F46F80|nr:HAMP domain-containing sensor histidine kinase [Halarcobacter sp.]